MKTHYHVEEWDYESAEYVSKGTACGAPMEEGAINEQEADDGYAPSYRIGLVSCEACKASRGFKVGRMLADMVAVGDACDVSEASAIHERAHAGRPEDECSGDYCRAMGNTYERMP
jgi:hypothetical protein